MLVQQLPLPSPPGQSVIPAPPDVQLGLAAPAVEPVHAPLLQVPVAQGQGVPSCPFRAAGSDPRADALLCARGTAAPVLGTIDTTAGAWSSCAAFSAKSLKPRHCEHSVTQVVPPPVALIWAELGAHDSSDILTR
jgi:hypothetical protein